MGLQCIVETFLKGLLNVVGLLWSDYNLASEVTETYLQS